MDIRQYRPKEGAAEIIVKYRGKLSEAVEQIGGSAEILSPDFAIVTIPINRLEELYRLPETIYTEIPKRLYFMRFSSQSSVCIYDEIDRQGLDGSGVLIGIIDSGIDIYNRDFINENGSTRIVGILDLSANPPREYTREQINKALLGEAPISFKDEIGHGTAIAGISAGNGRSSGYMGIAPKAELIIVKLGIREGYTRSTDIMRGLRYIRDIAENRPVAINISYGTSDGAHDGSSLAEAFINQVAENTLCSICIAMGNEGAAGHHYYGSFSDGEPIVFNVGGNVQSLYLSLWKSFLDDVELVLTAPDGDSSQAIAADYSGALEGAELNVLFSIPSPYSIDTEIYINLAKEGGIPTGLWTLELIPRSVVNDRFDIWLPVTEAVGRDTYFLRPDADITLTLPSSALKAISVGGYNQQTETAADFSGRGYTRGTSYIKPDIVAPAVGVPAPSVGGGVDLFTGTSFAAPHAVGAAALLMQWGIVWGRDLFLYGQRLKAYLQKGAVRYDNVVYPNRVLGYGRLCFENSLRLAEQNAPITVQQLNVAETTAQAAYSEDYYDFVRRKSGVISEGDYEGNILFCPINEDFEVLYIKRDYYELNKTRLTNRLGIRQPFVMGLMEYETALEKSGITMAQNQPYLNLKGGGVLVAVIDTGIDYGNEAFIYEDGTSKILFLWNQDVQSEGSEGLCFGREYTQEDINRALRGEIDIPVKDALGHGTALAEIAAGRNGAAPDSELIIVKLKQAKGYLREEMFLKAETAAYESSDLMLGISYVLKKAESLNRPVVICIGTGTNQGGHIGQSALEEYLEYSAKRYGVCLCVPMGNEGIARHHAVAEFAPQDNYKEIELTVGENERGVNIWIWSFIVNAVAVELVSPLGETVARLQPIANYQNSFALTKGGGTVEVSYYIPEEEAGDQYTHIRIGEPAAGIWTIRLYNNGSGSGRVHLWLPISAFIGRDTYFLSSDPSITLTNPATADGVMAVGGYNTADNSIYPQTGRGPTRLNSLRPYFCAPAVNLNGRSGTSLACAVAAGAAALMMEWLVVRNGVYTANTVMITSYLTLGASSVPNEQLPDNVWGYGRLNLYSSFENL